MARAPKGVRHITVGDVAYRWRASGNDGWIGITIWPADQAGATLTATVDYHQAWSEPTAGGGRHPMRQIIVTNRTVRRIIEYAVSGHGYAPRGGGRLLALGRIDAAVDLNDAVHANDKWW